jgi:molybdopterin synthase sulfur carrier subunit
MKVLFFARARDLAGAAEMDVDLPTGQCVGDLRRWLAEQLPSLATLLPHCAFAVNDEYASDAALLSDGDCVALLPPVSGG